MAFRTRVDAICCKLCTYETNDGKDFSRHLHSCHEGISFEQYAIKTNCGGIRPLCLKCGNETRFVHKKMSFQTYCKEHSFLAESAGGKKGGTAPCPFKGETKETREHLRLSSESMMGPNNPFYGKNHTVEARANNSEKHILGGFTLEERIAARASDFELLTPIEEYRSRQQQYLLFRCTTCGSEQNKTLQAFERGSLCRTCYPSESQWSIEVGKFLEDNSDKCLHEVRSVITPKELDHWIPSKNFAVECHGLYWHSELSPDGIVPDAHRQKWELCTNLNVKLVSLFEDEWKKKRDICESILLHKLGRTATKIHARKCEIVEIDYTQANEFLAACHLSGSCTGALYLALRSQGKNVAVMVLREPRQMGKYEGCIEIGRYAPALNTHVMGGLSKLLGFVKAWARSNEYHKILTYADRRLGNGGGYSTVGFKSVSQVELDYWYTDGSVRLGRETCKADKEISERQKAKDAGVGRIYGCGSNVLLLDIEESEKKNGI